MNKKVFNLILGVNETRVLVQHELCEYKCGLNKVYVIQSKNGIMMNIGVSVKMTICGMLVHVTVSVMRHVKLTNT